MRVAIISNFFPPDFVGGAEIYAYRLGRELVKNSIEVHVITSTKDYGIKEEIDGMIVHRVLKSPPFSKSLGKITGKIFGYNFNPYSYKLKSVLDKIKPDIIHIHNISSTIMLYPLINYLNVPTVAHIHDHWPICYKGTLYNQKKKTFCSGNCVECAFPFGMRWIGFFNLMIRNKLLKLFEKRIDCFITPSNYLKDILLDHGYTDESKIRHIPLGIDIEEFKYKHTISENENLSILFVGRVANYKNPMMILKLMPEILRHISCEYKIIGAGEDIHLIEYTSREMKIEKNIKILGKISQVNKLIDEMQKATIIVVPSLLNENSPVVIYESLALGIPLIVTNRGGGKELIKDGYNGYIVDPENEKEWTLRIVKILTDENLRKTMSFNSRKSAEELKIQNQVVKIIDLYNSILHYKVNNNV